MEVGPPEIVQWGFSPEIASVAPWPTAHTSGEILESLAREPGDSYPHALQ